MSNQRPGKVVRAIEPSMKDMSMYKFFKLANKVLLDSVKKTKHFTLNKWRIGWNKANQYHLQRNKQ